MTFIEMVCLVSMHPRGNGFSIDELSFAICWLNFHCVIEMMKKNEEYFSKVLNHFVLWINSRQNSETLGPGCILSNKNFVVDITTTYVLQLLNIVVVTFRFVLAFVFALIFHFLFFLSFSIEVSRLKMEKWLEL